MQESSMSQRYHPFTTVNWWKDTQWCVRGLSEHHTTRMIINDFNRMLAVSGSPTSPKPHACTRRWFSIHSEGILQLVSQALPSALRSIFFSGSEDLHSSLCHQPGSQQREELFKPIHLSRLGKIFASCSFCKSPSVSFPSHPLEFLLSTYYSLKLPCTLVYFFSVMRLPWAQGPFCPAQCTHPMPRTVCGPERCAMNMCWMEIRKEAGEGRGTTSSNGEDSHAPRV